MSRLGEENGAGNAMFSWGRKTRIGGKNLDIQYYESFTYDGVEYFLYDSVYMWSKGQKDPYVGKLVKIFETVNLEKVVKIVWYFRPTEIQRWLKGTPLSNELLLASCEGEGLYNLNPLEAICGQCNVICTSKDERNPRASTEELKMADYIFSRTFDVGKCKLSERFPDKIAGVEVRHFFNQKGNLSKATKFKTDVGGSAVKDEHPGRGNFTEGKSVLKISAGTVDRGTGSSAPLSDSYPLKKRKFEDTEIGSKSDNQPLELKRRPEVDSSKWFKQQSWEDRMQKAKETGSLVLLENLDPSITSSEVEDIVLRAFSKKVSAKLIQHNSFSSPYYGQALVIFKSKDDADLAISQLNSKCLMLGKERFHRPVVGRRPLLKEPSDPSKFYGHLTVDKMKKKQRAEQRNALSTSHYSQPNTIEFDMAMEWLALQKQSDIWWDALHKQQAQEIAELRTKPKAAPSKEKLEGSSKEWYKEHPLEPPKSRKRDNFTG